MKVIWKFPIPLGGGLIEIPRAAQILHAGEQEGTITVWALVDPNADRVDREIRITGTGHDHEDAFFNHGLHLGTVFTGPFVLHIFDGGEAVA